MRGLTIGGRGATRNPPACKCESANMNKSSLRGGKSRAFFFLLIIYALLGLFFLNFYRYQLDPDGVSYISIAEKYKRGDFRNAVNVYWGPLLSWILVPFLLLGIPTLISTKLVSLCIGFFTIIALKSLSHRFQMSDNIRRVVMLLLVPIVLQFALWIFTPDLLLTCILLYYFSVIFRPDYPEKTLRGASCGAIGAIAYLAKSYGFAFFLSHFTLFNALHYLNHRTGDRKGKVLRNFVMGLAVFCILTAPWIYIVSHKYGDLTIGLSGRYSWRVVGPESEGQAALHLGFLGPPNGTAVSGWEDPSRFTMAPWSPFESWNYFLYEVRHILRNVYGIIITCESFFPLAVTILLGYILICSMPLHKLIARADALYPLLTILVYGAGYVVFLVELRYLWVICLLLVPMGGHLLHRLFGNDFFDATRRKIAMFFFVLSFVAIPLAQLVRDLNVGKNIYHLSRRLESLSDIRGNAASNDRWRESLCLAYHMNFRYYGIPRPGIAENDLQSELRRNHIDYFLVWDEGGETPRFVSGCEEVTRGNVSGLRVYYLGYGQSASRRVGRGGETGTSPKRPQERGTLTE